MLRVLPADSGAPIYGRRVLFGFSGEKMVSREQFASVLVFTLLTFTNLTDPFLPNKSKSHIELILRIHPVSSVNGTEL